MLWGLILGCHAACTSFAGLAICRTLLGVFESCVAPILVLIIAMWYKKEEQGRRVSWFYVCNSLTMIFGGLLAYGVSFIQSKFASWRIFFVAIGGLTIGVGALVCVFLPDSPVKAKRFSDAEKVAALLRTKSNQSGTQNAHLKRAQVSILRPTTISAKCSGLRNFQGYSCLASMPLHNAQLHSKWWHLELQHYSPHDIRIHVKRSTSHVCSRWRNWGNLRTWCWIPIRQMEGSNFSHAHRNSSHYSWGWSDDRLGPQRCSEEQGRIACSEFLDWYLWRCIHASARLECIVCNPIRFMFSSNIHSNIAGHTKKVTINALTMVSFATGNILGTQTFQAKEAPGYVSGKISIIATLSALCFMIMILRWYNGMLNRKNERILDRLSEEQKAEMREKMAFADQTDRKNPFSSTRVDMQWRIYKHDK